MEQISYKQRDCQDEERIGRFLAESRIGVVGIPGDAYPYAVPVNYVWHKGKIYFHGMGSGKKMRLLGEKADVCFTVYHEHGTVTDPVPCHADTAYLSVMIFGQAERVADFEEAAEALQQVLEKYTPGFYGQTMSAKMVERYRSAKDSNPVSVFRIMPGYLTAKENPVDLAAMFKHHHGAHDGAAREGHENQPHVAHGKPAHGFDGHHAAHTAHAVHGGSHPSSVRMEE